MISTHRLALVFALALAGCSAASSLAPAVRMQPNFAMRTHSSTRTGVVVPLYVDPGKTWSTAIAAKVAHPNVPMVFIANVYNGPGSNIIPAYVKFIAKAQHAGIYVLGYVYTSSGRRSATAVDADMAKWSAFYHTDGVFLDEMAPNDPSYYTAATQYAHGHSLWFVMGNPGTDASGASGPDVINFYEQRGYPKLAFLRKPSHLSYGKARWSYIAGEVPFNGATIAATSAYVGYLFATDGKEPECYCRLPSYFVQLVAALDS